MGKDTYLFWIYDGDYFLGGGYSKFKQDAENELKWRQQKHPNARIVWEKGKYTLFEANDKALQKAFEIQRTQPGIREPYRPPQNEIESRIPLTNQQRLQKARAILGDEIADQIEAVGEIEKLPNLPKQLSGGKDAGTK